MFDSIQLGIPKDVKINRSFLEGRNRLGRPTRSYERPIVVEDDGFSIRACLLREDGHIEANIPMQLRFNGFEVGSYERVNRVLEKIVGNENVHKLILQNIEMCIDIQLETIELIKSVYPSKNLGAQLWSKFIEKEPHLEQKEHSELPFVESFKRSNVESIVFGTLGYHQTIIYNKYKQLSDKGKKTLNDRKDLDPFTRIEIKIGRKCIGKYCWGELEQWVKKIRLFDGLIWKNINNDIFDVRADDCSLEGLSKLGTLSLVRNYNIPWKVILKKVKDRPVWEKEFLEDILKNIESVKMPDLDALFQESVSRFFYKEINSSLPILLWNEDGTGYKKVPPEIFLLRKEKKVTKSVGLSHEEHE